RQIGYKYNHLAPWSAYGYDATFENNVELNNGVGLDEHSDGSQAAFVAAWYETTSGAYAGFGLSYPFPQPWSLPSDTNRWGEYSFSFDFKEQSGFPCVLEMQVTSPPSYDDKGNPLPH